MKTCLPLLASVSYAHLKFLYRPISGFQACQSSCPPFSPVPSPCDQARCSLHRRSVSDKDCTPEKSISQDALPPQPIQTEKGGWSYCVWKERGKPVSGYRPTSSGRPGSQYNPQPEY